MNVGFVATERRAIAAFTWIWLAGSVLASAYFAFWLWPGVLAARTTANVGVYFQIKTEGGTGYRQNTKENRQTYRDVIADSQRLWFSKCELLLSWQRPSCNSSDNWWGLSLSKLKCDNFAACFESRYVMSERERDDELMGVTLMPGASMPTAAQTLSWSDPTGWGSAAQGPLFFVSLFLALKLGRALGEFLFAPYQR